MQIIRTTYALRLVIAVALGQLFLGASATSAQQATPEPIVGATPVAAATPVVVEATPVVMEATPVVVEVTGPLMAAIVEGTCADLGEVAFDLGEVEAPEIDEDDGVRGVAPEAPLLTLDEEVGDVNFDTLLDEAPHALVASAGADAPVACGNLGGDVQDDTLVVPLAPVGGSNYAGFAILEQDAAPLGIGSDEVEVELYVFQV